jgi:GTP-binding protein
VVQPDQEESFVVADIPGLIEGAHQGAGLGIRFLRHIERTRILIHLIDASSIDPQAPLSSYDIINGELAQYNPLLMEKPQVVVLNKMDIDGTAQIAETFKAAVGDRPVMTISAAARRGIEALKLKLVEILNNPHAV